MKLHRMTIKPRTLKRVASLAAFIFISLLLLRIIPAQPLSAGVPSSVSIHDHHGKLMRLTLARDDKYRQWVPLDSLSPALVDAVLLKEDRHFYHHWGVNPWALMRAAISTYTGGTRMGGSTLTMQLARIKYGLKTRTTRGKLKQMAEAIWLESRYSKRDILEAYLNLAPYGQNIEGVSAASLIYFGKDTQALSLAESLTLAVIPQSPTRRALRHFNAVDPSATFKNALQPETESKTSLSAARARLFAAWVERHPKDADKAGLLALPMTFRTTSQLPFTAPHVVDSIMQREAAESVSIKARKNAHRIDTTIDARTQALLERVVARHLTRAGRDGIKNASAMLVDFTTQEVKAVVGSANYFDVSIEGQVNGTLSKRSPGSTLKPFVYGLALDQGVIHPQSVLKDAPIAYGAFSPENFDGRFVGPITAQEALIRSRNIPAVSIAAKLKKPNLHQFLKTSGVTKMKSEQHYGLALALGGGEVTMEELATLYVMLANNGELKKVHYRKRDNADRSADKNVEASENPPIKPRKMLSDEAAYITLDMLRNNPRPDDASISATGRRNLPVAWKTGTSWGFHDAWTAGVFGKYVLIVWMGNFNNDPNPALVGIHAAAPLFFGVVDALAQQEGSAIEVSGKFATQTLPKDLRRVSVCTASGDLPNIHCPATSDTWFIAGKSPIRVSNIHRAIAIDTRTNQAACFPFDRQNVRYEVHEFWPSDLQRLFAQAGMARRTPPSTAHCALSPQQANNEGAPMITSPIAGVSYVKRANIGSTDVNIADSSTTSSNNDLKLTLSATVAGDARRLFWFVEDGFVGESIAGKAIPWIAPGPGKFTLRVVDDLGRADSRSVNVVAGS